MSAACVKLSVMTGTKAAGSLDHTDIGRALYLNEELLGYIESYEVDGAAHCVKAIAPIIVYVGLRERQADITAKYQQWQLAVDTIIETEDV